MQDIGAVEMPLAMPPPRAEVTEPINFTPVQGVESRPARRPSEPEEIGQDSRADADVNALMAEILTQGQPKKPEEIEKQVKKTIPVEAQKKQRFFARIVEKIKIFF